MICGVVSNGRDWGMPVLVLEGRIRVRDGAVFLVGVGVVPGTRNYQLQAPILVGAPLPLRVLRG